MRIDGEVRTRVAGFSGGQVHEVTKIDGTNNERDPRGGEDIKQGSETINNSEKIENTEGDKKLYTEATGKGNYINTEG